MSTVVHSHRTAETQPIDGTAEVPPGRTTAAPPPTAAPAQPVVVQNAPVRSNLPGLVGLGLAIIGFVLAVFLLTAGLAWLLLIPGIALGVIGLFMRNRRKGSAVAAIVIGVMGLLLSIIGFRLPTDSLNGGLGGLNNTGVNPIGTLLGGYGLAGAPHPAGAAGTGSGASTTGGGSGGGASGTASGSGSGLLGTASGSGLGVGVSSVDCHTPLATATGLNITGSVCAVKLNVTNQGTKPVDVDSSDVTASVGGSKYAADAKLGGVTAKVGAGRSGTGASASAGTGGSGATGSGAGSTGSGGGVSVDVGSGGAAPAASGGDLLSAHVDPGQSTTGTVYVNVPQGTAGLDSLTVGTGGDAASGTGVTVNLGQ